LVPLGDSATLAAARSGRLDYGRIRVWGSVSFIAASIASGAVLAAASGEPVVVLVVGASVLVLIACLRVPDIPRADVDKPRIGIRAITGDARFWLLIMAASALQASHQVYYGFGTLYWRRLGIPDTVIGCLWAEGVLAEIVLFWLARPLISRIGPVGLMALGGAAGVVRWSLAGVSAWLPLVAGLQLLHAFTFGASHLGAVHFLSRTAPSSAAASAQSLYAALSSAVGGGFVMLVAGRLYSDYGGGAYYFMAALSLAGLIGVATLHVAAAGRRNQ
jgi:PPP family 3-phenylpropionic acid transporter